MIPKPAARFSRPSTGLSFLAGDLAATCASVACALQLQPAVLAQSPQQQPAATKQATPSPQQPDDPMKQRIDTSVTRGVEIILALQEGDTNAEWPYEGVYRVGGEIPIGYRVGGTSICAMALLAAPGYGEDVKRQESVARALRFVLDSREHQLMNPDYEGGYDVRGWGYTYALLFLLDLESRAAVPTDLADEVKTAIAHYIDAIEQTEIAEVGGWNYARARGKAAVSPPSPFMTAPTLQALFLAASRGYEVDPGVVQRGLNALDRGRTPSGSIAYSGEGAKARDGTPGAVGRMLCAETTLLLAGRSSVANVRAALDAFIAHWAWLEKRRAQQGTHAPPYGVAPYYFYFAHYQAALAVEMLPEPERSEYRRRVRELTFQTQAEDGSWNDRVFERSRNYGTAMSIMGLLMPDLPRLPRWESAQRVENAHDAEPDANVKGEGASDTRTTQP